MIMLRAMRQKLFILASLWHKGTSNFMVLVSGPKLSLILFLSSSLVIITILFF
jgi:hypothetical protein